MVWGIVESYVKGRDYMHVVVVVDNHNEGHHITTRKETYQGTFFLPHF